MQGQLMKILNVSVVGCVVHACTPLTVCRRMVPQRLDCGDPKCYSLHVCWFFLSPTGCRFTDCSYSHDLWSAANCELLENYGLTDLSLDDLCFFFKVK